MRFENPVLPGFHPDPSVCRVGETFYLATSSFEYFPGVPIYRSSNLVDWEPVGHALDRDSQLDVRDARISGGVFAPTLRVHDGTFYLTTTNTSDGGHFVVTAEDPAGEWSDPVWVDAPGIDPDLFWDEGTCYFTYFSTDVDRGIEQATLDPETGELGDPHTVWTGWEDPHAEAPHLYERDGTYYLVVAEGGTHTGHMVVAARADDPTGPFEPCPSNPVVSHREDFYYDIRATGHADLVTDAAGGWWLVCLGIRPQAGFPGWHHLGRETFLAPVSWEDGWPVVADGEIPQSADVDLPGDDVDRDGPSPIEYTDTDFSEGRTHEWLWRHNPDRERYEFGTDGLVLWGGPEGLDEQGTTFLGRRQTNMNCRVRTDLAVESEFEGEAGLTLFMDEEHHYDLGVVGGDGGGSGAVVRLQIGDASEVVARESVGEEVTLGVNTASERYEFVVDGESVATARPKYLSTEVAGGFTGVFVGVYATGNGEACDSPARFERFVCESVE